MAFCSGCGEKQTKSAVFCPKCGTANATAAAQVSETTAAPVEGIDPTLEPTPAPDVKSKLGPLGKLPKPLLVGIPVLVVLAIVGAVVGIKALNAPTKANAKTFMISTADVPFDADEDTDVTNYTTERIFGEDCVAGQTLSALLQSGEQWAASGIKRAGETQNYYYINQQIIALESEDDAKAAIAAATDVASDDTCDSSSYSSTIAYDFEYEKAQPIQDAVGVGADGVALNHSSWIYMKLSTLVAATETNAGGYYAFVRRGNLLMVLYVSASEADGSESDLVTKAELSKAIAPFVSKFAG